MENIIYTGKADLTAVILKHTVKAVWADMKNKTFKEDTVVIFTGEVKNVNDIIRKAVKKVNASAEAVDVKTEKVLASMTFQTFMEHATLGDVPKTRQ